MEKYLKIGIELIKVDHYFGAMSDKNVKVETDAELVLKYDYHETKDMCKQFLTLVTTVLVISLTFSEKVIGFNSAAVFSKWSLVIAWVSLLLSITSCGIGLLLITVAAGQAAYSKIKNYQQIGLSFKMIVLAGGLFVLGLILLIASVIGVLFQTATTSLGPPHG